MKSKLFSTLSIIIVLAIIITPQITYASWFSSVISGAGHAISQAATTVETVAVQAVNDVTNVVVGATEATYGAAVGLVNTVATSIGLHPVSTQGYVQGLESDGENRIDNGVNNEGIIAGSDTISCSTDSTTLLVGSTATWNAGGGSDGETYTLHTTDNPDTTIEGHGVSPVVSFSVQYTTPGIKTASVSAELLNRSDGTVDCSGEITVVQDQNQLQSSLGQNGQSGTGSGLNGSLGNININSIGNSLGSALGTVGNPIQITSQCVPTEIGLPAGTVYSDQSMKWTVANLPISLSGINVSWLGNNISAKTSLLDLSSIYTTIGQKTLTATTTGVDINGTHYISVCNATTTVLAPARTDTEI